MILPSLPQRLPKTLIFVHPALQYRVADNFFAAFHIKFFETVCFVGFGCFDRDVHFIGDFFVAVTESDMPQHFGLTRSQLSASCFAS
jgi:hypothetical protein